MAEEKDGKVHEGEVVDQETGLAQRSIPVTIDQLANAEDGLVVLERGIQIIKTLRAASIALTMPQDWVLFKADDRITGFLQDAGCERIFDLWGIEQYDLSDPYRTDDKETGHFSISIDGAAFSKRTGNHVEKVTGVRYSFEEFIARRRLPALQIEPEVRKAARRNLDGTHCRELAGLKSVPVEELDQVWSTAGMTWKSSKFCAKGRGFGTQAERQGANVQQADDLKPGEEPVCDGCERTGKPSKMKFVPGGVSSRTQKPYEAFWSCTVKDSGHKTIPHTEYMKTVAERREASERANNKEKDGQS